MIPSLSRRKFIKSSSAIILGSPMINLPISCKTKSKQDTSLDIHIFSKHLQFLNYNDMADAARTMGFNGIDLTVRPKGHVLPEKVEDDLPRATEAMEGYGFAPNMMTTNVTNAFDPGERNVLEVASKLNYNYYRLGYLKYSSDKSIPESIAEFNLQFAELAELNKELKISGAYQNHAGNHVGAPIWDIDQILENIPPSSIGCQYDIRHATVEGGTSWQLGLELIRDHITSLVIKDFKWGKVNGKWKPVHTPLGEGMVDFHSFFQLIKKYNFNLPISLHVEYDLGGAEKGKSKLSIPHAEVFQNMKKDLNFLRDTWKNLD